jgi:hypothetical protein
LSQFHSRELRESDAEGKPYRQNQNAC